MGGADLEYRKQLASQRPHRKVLQGRWPGEAVNSGGKQSSRGAPGGQLAHTRWGSAGLHEGRGGGWGYIFPAPQS